jgi:hypothetical protein
MSRIVELDQCSQCPWLKWTAEPRCGHPETLDKKMKDITDLPDWCPLDELVAVDDD